MLLSCLYLESSSYGTLQEAQVAISCLSKILIQKGVASGL